MKQAFWLYGRMLGKRELPSTWPADPRGSAAGTYLPYRNTAFFCPTCGEVWGKVSYADKEQGVSWQVISWQVEERHCSAHPAPNRWAEFKRGSFAIPFKDWRDPLQFEGDWPEEVVRHEFWLLLDKFDGKGMK